jgi:hypothetical protein
MALDAMSRRSAINAVRRFLRVTSTTKIMKLSFEQWPYILGSSVTIHARPATGIVIVIVMTEYAVLGRVVCVCE